MASEKTLRAVCKDTANAIRSKTGKTAKIKPINFADEINNITVDNTTLNALIDRTITEISNDTVTKIGSYALAYSTKLTQAIFPNVTQVLMSSFFACSQLTFAKFSSLTSIGDYAFCDCRNLKTFINEASSVCTLAQTRAFQNTPIATSTTEGYIYVPDELVDSYKAATNWITYATKIKGLSELPNS